MYYHNRWVQLVVGHLPELVCDSVDVSAAVSRYQPGDSAAVVLSCCLTQAPATRPAGCTMAVY